MIDKFFDALGWVSTCVTRFEMYHWAICLALLLLVGFLSMRGLGVRSTR